MKFEMENLWIENLPGLLPNQSAHSELVGPLKIFSFLIDPHIHSSQSYQNLLLTNWSAHSELPGPLQIQSSQVDPFQMNPLLPNRPLPKSTSSQIIDFCSYNRFPPASASTTLKEDWSVRDLRTMSTMLVVVERVRFKLISGWCSEWHNTVHRYGNGLWPIHAGKC